MLLARGCVKKAFKTARVCQIRHAPLKAFLYSPRIQNHCAKSGSLGFFNELRKRVRTFHGRFVYCGNGEGIEVLAKPIFVRAQPFNGSGTAVPFNGWHAPCLGGAPCSLFIQKHCAKSGTRGFSERTPEACTNLLCVRFVFYWGIEEGIEVLAEPIFVRGCAPSMEVRLAPFNGWHAPCLYSHFWGNGYVYGSVGLFA